MSLLDGLIGYWTFDEASGTRVKNEIDGVMSSEFVGTVTVDYAGKVGRGKKFNGGYYPVPLVGGAAGARSYAFWIKLLSTESNGNLYLIGRSSGFSLLMGYGGANRITWWGSSLYGSSDSARGITVPKDDQFHHCVFTYDNTNLKGYFDNTLLWSIATGNAIGTDNFTVGAFNGGFDELGIWSRAITADEVADLYNAGAGVVYPFYFYDVAGTVKDANDQAVQRKVRAYRRSDGKFMGETQSSPTTGEYTLLLTTSEEVNLIMLDDAAGTFENDQILRTTPA